MRIRRHDEAEKQARAAIAIDPLKAAGWLHLAWALHREEDDEPALEAVGKALAQSPENAWGHRLRSGILTHMGRHQDALDEAAEALRLTPEHPFAFHRYAACLSNLGRHDDALEALDRSLEQDPEDASVWDTRAAVLSDLGRSDEAVEASEKAVALDPESVRLINRLGDMLSKAGRKEEAVQAFHRAIKTDPTNGHAKKRLQDTVDEPRVRRALIYLAIFALALGASLLLLGPCGPIGCGLPVAAGLVAIMVVHSRLRPDEMARWEEAAPGVRETLETMAEDRKRRE